MAGSEIRLPDLKEKARRLHAKDATPAGLTAQAEQYLEAGWLSDAIDFFDKARDAKGLERVMEQAIETGDAFLLRRCLKCLGKEDKEGDWGRLAGRALELEKLMFAREGFRMAGDRKNLDRVDAMLKPPAPAPETVLEAGFPDDPPATSATRPPEGGGTSNT
jgi:hypothetical protein